MADVRHLAAADAPAFRALRLREHPEAFTSGRVRTVTEGNEAATGLYERAGFRSFGVELDAIRVGGRGFARQHMSLQLAPP